MLIRKFAEGFNGLENKPALVLKTSSASFSIKERERVRRSIQNILFGIQDPPSVYLVFGTLTDEEMNELYNHPKIKAFVSFTKGEGFGRPMLEFTMTGKPVLASNWSGHLDFLNEDLSVRLNGELKDVHPSAADQFIIQGSKWFQVDYDDAILKMKDVVSHYDSYLKRAEMLREENMNNFSLGMMNDTDLGVFILDEKNNIYCLKSSTAALPIPVYNLEFSSLTIEEGEDFANYMVKFDLAHGWDRTLEKVATEFNMTSIVNS
jgi:glycosyltransferase involved in cell wall biosynthesis